MYFRVLRIREMVKWTITERKGEELFDCWKADIRNNKVKVFVFYILLGF